MTGVKSVPNHDGVGGAPSTDPPSETAIVDSTIASAAFKEENTSDSGKWAFQACMIDAGKIALDPSVLVSASDVSLSCRVPKSLDKAPALRNAKSAIKQLPTINPNAVIGSHKSMKTIDQISDFPESEKTFNEFFAHRTEAPPGMARKVVVCFKARSTKTPCECKRERTFLDTLKAQKSHCQADAFKSTPRVVIGVMHARHPTVTHKPNLVRMIKLAGKK